jgi:hypothetical protein
MFLLLGGYLAPLAYGATERHTMPLACSIGPPPTLSLSLSIACWLYIYADVLLCMHNKAQISLPQDARNYKVVLYWPMWMLHWECTWDPRRGRFVGCVLCVRASHPKLSWPAIFRLAARSPVISYTPSAGCHDLRAPPSAFLHLTHPLQRVGALAASTSSGAFEFVVSFFTSAHIHALRPVQLTRALPYYTTRCLFTFA